MEAIFHKFFCSAQHRSLCRQSCYTAVHVSTKLNCEGEPWYILLSKTNIRVKSDFATLKSSGGLAALMMGMARTLHSLCSLRRRAMYLNESMFTLVRSREQKFLIIKVLHLPEIWLCWLYLQTFALSNMIRLFDICICIKRIVLMVVFLSDLLCEMRRRICM